MVFPRLAARQAIRTALPLRPRSEDSKALRYLLVARPVGEILGLVTRQLSGHRIRVQRLYFGRFPKNPLQNSFPGREKCGAALWAGLPWNDLPRNDLPCNGLPCTHPGGGMVFHAVDATTPYRDPYGCIQRAEGSRMPYPRSPWHSCGGRKLSGLGGVT